ncbi:hypothetical protein [Aurantiacibacter suaedae]|uniref:hypothetical protein n=1 Tax=Aurantiacibacter suaedae TaxID=2545755 RepID=UPI0010F46F2F|nr:hypothetical protein [Aurantiacibacter suaedae]
MAPTPSPWPASSRFWLAFVAALTLGLGACGEEGRVPRSSEPDSPTTTPTPTSPLLPSAGGPSPPPGYTDGSGINEHYPDLTPKPLAEDLEGTEVGARNVLLSFIRAIELREYDQAWGMLDESAQQGWSKAAFNAFFDGLSNITVSAPGGQIEGAAGSSYYTSQTELTATDANGRPVQMDGALVLRRVNDVPGASERQLRWQVSRVDLKRPQ